MRRLIRAYEFEKLTTHSDELGRFITKRELEAMYKFNDLHQNLYFTGIQNGVRFKNYVGVIQIGGLTLEILPKSDKHKPESVENHNELSLTWQRALLKMLAVCKKVKLDSVSEANLKRREYSLLELYFEMFIDELEHLIRLGLIKKYRNKAGNVSALKGRLDFSKQIQHNLLHKERFYTHHQTYDQNHLLHQILYQTIIVLDNMPLSGTLNDRLARLFLNFPEVSEFRVNKSHFEKIILTRKTKPYEPALQIAKMINLNYSPDITRGQENMLALLFDMNKLWEEYVYRVLLKTEQNEFEVREQRSKQFWDRKTIRPDIVLNKKDSSEVFVIDTKWKMVEPGEPSDDDLKQMFAYNIYWNAQRSMLLYPGAESESEYFGRYHKGNDKGHFCKLGFVHVLDDEGKLDSKLGERIIAKLR